MSDELISRLAELESHAYMREIESLTKLQKIIQRAIDGKEVNWEQDYFMSAANQTMRMSWFLHSMKSVQFEGYKIPEHMLLWADISDQLFGTTLHPDHQSKEETVDEDTHT